MKSLINELKNNESLMKRIAKDKVNGLRETTIAVIWSEVKDSNWAKSNKPEESLASCKFVEDTYNNKFMAEVFNELAKEVQ